MLPTGAPNGLGNRCTQSTEVHGPPQKSTGPLGVATIEFWPQALCIESKSLKLYLSGFRSEGHFCEALAVRIRNDVAEALELPPDQVRVTLEQRARGGITITATS